MDEVTIEYYASRVEELISGIDAGDFSGEIIPDKYRWEHLAGLFYLRDRLDGGDEFFSDIYRLAIQSGINYVRRKVQREEKIIVCFQNYSAAQWPAEEFYSRISNTKGVDARVLVSPLADRDEESRMDAYRKTLKWFLENGYKVIEGINQSKGSFIRWADMDAFPDVLYMTSPWFYSLPSAQWFTLLPLRCLPAYIPYGMYLADSRDGSYAIDAVYNKDCANLTWRVYCDSIYNLNGYKNHQLLRGENVRYSGYVKMDYFYTSPEFSDEKIAELWKIPRGMNPKVIKKIIIAPHFSISSGRDINYSTFRENAWFFLYLARKYKDDISFVFKPHPNLRIYAVASKMFRSYEDYDKYIEEWNSLPNAKVVQEASYLEYFASSDAMIMDSGSFLGEYLYTGKPLLYLRRPEQTFMEIGWKVLDAYYQTPGENYTEIENFVEKVVIGGEDNMLSQRKRVFEEEFNYQKANGISATDYLYQDFINLISDDV
ncbi:CDP-glycerol glycerophosphotransferase family protein [Butyrivibrio fibrisolvens]|uniref:CDP-glycerol glycerophosphotransferase family protein n=1 Tax=Butyrivibrio fibrisolvens TaxID=831 RepID=UPI0003B776D5|nr:CDP-glycerol glycerophosphotransferase family protein [Butyrivibrio fibrisolvens]